MRKSVSSAVCGALLAAACRVYGQEDQRDVVALTTDNRLEGQILGLARGKLAFAIDGAGPVEIDWSNVETLRSPREFDVELETGERLSGAILSPSPGRLAVTAGTASPAVETQDVIRITPIAATPAERTSGYVDLGLDFLTANDELDLKIDAEAENVMRNYVTTLSFDAVVSEFDDETVQRRNYFQIRSRRLLANRWFAIGRLHFEEDRELDLDARTLLGFGGGRTLLQSNRAVVALYGGLAADRERYRSVPGTEDNAEAFVTVEWDWFELGGDTRVTTNATTFLGFDRGRRRVELDARLERAIFGNMHWSVSVYESYDSDPPEGLENSDLGFSFAIGRSF
ncbi:MAG: DUF481 domain-containing protein [Gammaproteobacteria bacterium]|nr:hypothetical protein [Gammaproteobacteria bacterium]